MRVREGSGTNPDGRAWFAALTPKTVLLSVVDVGGLIKKSKELVSSPGAVDRPLVSSFLPYGRSAHPPVPLELIQLKRIGHSVTLRLLTSPDDIGHNPPSTPDAN